MADVLLVMHGRSRPNGALIYLRPSVWSPYTNKNDRLQKPTASVLWNYSRKVLGVIWFFFQNCQFSSRKSKPKTYFIPFMLLTAGREHQKQKNQKEIRFVMEAFRSPPKTCTLHSLWRLVTHVIVIWRYEIQLETYNGRFPFFSYACRSCW